MLSSFVHANPRKMSVIIPAYSEAGSLPHSPAASSRVPRSVQAGIPSRTRQACSVAGPLAASMLDEGFRAPGELAAD